MGYSFRVIAGSIIDMDPRRGMVGWSWSPKCFTLLLQPYKRRGQEKYFVCVMYVNQVNQQSSIGQESFLSTEEIEDTSREGNPWI